MGVERVSFPAVLSERNDMHWQHELSKLAVSPHSCSARTGLCAQLANASYVWLPLVPAPNGYQIQDVQSWRLRDYCVEANTWAS